MTNLVGKIISGRYRVDEFLGRGGMAEVYKVWDQDRAVYLALKMLDKDLARDVVFLRRFRREAQNLAALQHPNIVRFYGLEQDGLQAFMLMDYIEGEDLKTEIFLHQGRGVPPKRILELIKPVCSAVAYAHKQGVVHCDLKPANILLENTGRLLVTDFGIARLTDSATATMVGAGTPAYMAPEQVKGLDPVPETDIYALGVVLFEMLTGGERPFTGEQSTTTGTTSAKVRWEQANLEPPSPRIYNREISKDLEAVVLKCLAKKPEQRYQTALELLNAMGLGMNVAEVATVNLETKQPMTNPDDQTQPVPVKSKVKGEAAPIRDREKQYGWKRWIGLAGAVFLVAAGLFFGLFNGGNHLFTDQSASLLPLDVSTEDLEITSTIQPTVLKKPSATPKPSYTVAPTITPTRILAIGSTQQSLVDGMVQAYIPAGDFLMGSTRAQADSMINGCKERHKYDALWNDYDLSNCEKNYKDELPEHQVYLDAFWMDQHEVTVEQFYQFLEDGSYSTNTIENPYQSAVYVDWYDAQLYCQWAGRRLPTEAEWEKAARGGLVEKNYPWGDQFPVCDVDKENGAQFNICGYGTKEIMRFSPNDYGLFDMAGNASEWVSDWYGYSQGVNVSNNPQGPETGVYKGIRGGENWTIDPFTIRVMNRSGHLPDQIAAGFRCTFSDP